MEKLTFDKVVGFVLAACFALVIGVSMWALLVGDYMNAVMTDQAQQTLRIVGFAGARRAHHPVGSSPRSAASSCAFCSRCSSSSAFSSFGGLLRVIFNHVNNPSQQDWSLQGLIGPRRATSSHS
jgi:hypothetical protein